MKLSWTGIRNAIAPRSPIGIALGGLAFLASLTPSLIPRTPAMQGIIAAFAFMLAYAIGAGLARLYRWLGLTSPEGKTRSTADRILIRCSASETRMGHSGRKTPLGARCALPICNMDPTRSCFSIPKVLGEARHGSMSRTRPMWHPNCGGSPSSPFCKPLMTL